MRRDLVFLRRIVGIVALLLLLVGGYAGNAKAQAWHSCTNITTDCTKEIRVYNNTGMRTIYVVWQGSIQKQPAINCPEGDSWLQNALNSPDCFKVNNTYLAFINPIRGIKPNEFVSIQIPWWSKSTDTSAGADQFVDWWRASRIYIFDDQTALNDSYLNPNKTQASLAAPVISCTMGGIAGNQCVANELQIYKVPDGSSAHIQDPTPFQLNEFTFADIPNLGLTNCNVTPLPDGCSLNVNFNVSYVDHIYLPVAIGPITPAKDIGYMGTTMPRDDFQRELRTFSGCPSAPCNAPTNWPVFNNPNNKYPNAGIKLPSTLAALGYYMSPGLDPQLNPILLPSSDNPGQWPTPSPTTLQQTATNWTICTGGSPGSACPQSALYDPIEDAFNLNYQSYLNTCPAAQRPAYLQPIPNSNPPRPANQFTLLRFLHGWVEFESEGCPILAPSRTKLPLSVNQPSPPNPKGQSGASPINYIALQYNWSQQPPPPPRLWFNAYTRLIHGTLQANAYAFSIDDDASVMNASAGGLILAVGGPNGLENTSQFPPPLPPWFQWYYFNIGMGAEGPGWRSYSFCDNKEQFFQPKYTPAHPPGFGFNPALFQGQFPCTMKFFDNNGKEYQFVIQKAGIPQKAIWPKFTQPQGFDSSVIKCPNPNDNWCQFINETADPGTDNPTTIPTYKLDLRSPF